jgi:hypothetical protein
MDLYPQYKQEMSICVPGSLDAGAPDATESEAGAEGEAGSN